MRSLRFQAHFLRVVFVACLCSDGMIQSCAIVLISIGKIFHAVIIQALKRVIC
jgi:hypothetical protein